MKKIFTLLFCAGLFTVSFAQPGGRHNRNNTGNQNPSSQGYGQYQNNRGDNENYSRNNGEYNQPSMHGNSYGHGREDNYERRGYDKRHDDRYNNHFNDHRWCYREYRHRRHFDPWFR